MAAIVDGKFVVVREVLYDGAVLFMPWSRYIFDWWLRWFLPVATGVQVSMLPVAILHADAVEKAVVMAGVVWCTLVTVYGFSLPWLAHGPRPWQKGKA